MNNDSNLKAKLTLENFQQLLYFGNQKINTVNLVKQVRLKKHVLYFIMCAVQSYSESIYKIISPPQIYDKAAEVLMRSLVEVYINLIYIYSCRTQKNALIFIADSVNERIDYAKKYKKFMKDNPSWDIPFGNIKKAEDWDQFIQQKQKEISSGEKKFKIKLPNKLPDLRARAISCDNYLKAKNKLTKQKSLEFYYIQYYKYFSQIAHLTMPGLERFYTEDEDGSHLNIDGKTEDVDRVVKVTYQLYFVIFLFFLKQFKIYNKLEFGQYELFSKKLLKR